MSDKYIGDFKKGQVIRVKFNTFSQAIVPATPSINPTVAIYKDSTIEFTTGVTQPTVDYDGKAGFHELVIDTSDAVYEAAKDYDIVITAGTVDGKDLTRTILRTFSIENRNTDANVTKIGGQTASAAAAVSFPASVANESTVVNRPTLAQIEGSTVLAKDSTVAKDATVAKDSTVAKDATVAKDSTVAKDATVAKEATLVNRPTLAQIEGSTVLAKDSTVAKDATVAKDSTVAKDATVAKEATLVNRPTLAQIEGSTVLAKKSDVPTASAIADAVLEESVDAHDNVAHSLAKYISIIKKANTVIDGVVTSATTPSTTSFSSNVNYPTGAFKHAVLLFTNAAAINEQNSPLLTYVNTNGVITVEEPFTTAPTVGDQFIIIPTNHVHSIAAIQNGLATSTALAAVATNVTALVTRIPATLFAGITSLANWLGAIAGKTADSTTRTQINATAAGANFNETTDSLEAIRDRGDAAWITGATGQGSGARIVTITVRDSSASPVEAATVRVYRAGETYAGVTNASGVTSFSLDDATFTVAITAAGFSFTPVSLVVSGNVSQTYTLTSTGGVTPSVAPRTTGFWTVNDVNGVAQAAAQVTIQASSPPPGSTGLAMEDAPRTATADNQGVVQFNNLVKGATYIVYRTGSSRKYNIVVPSTAGDSVALGSIVG
jgi:carbonic anhydrase/acetyltransferase-like protein (isoleucine patch superfamily)